MLANTSKSYYASGLKNQNKNIENALNKFKNQQKTIIDETEINNKLKEIWNTYLSENAIGEFLRGGDSSRIKNEGTSQQYTQYYIENMDETKENLKQVILNLQKFIDNKTEHQKIFQKLINDFDPESFKTTLNNYDKDTKDNLAYLRGQFGEFFISLILLEYGETITDFFKGLEENIGILTGGNLTTDRLLNINISNFNNEKTKKNKPAELEEINTVLKNITIGSNNKQIKADIYIPYLSGISVKVTKNNMVHLQSGPLLNWFFTTLKNESFFDNDFTVAYVRNRFSKSVKRIGHLEKLNSVLRKSIFIQALTGYQTTYNDQLKKLIVLQAGKDNDAPQIKVFNIEDILNTIKETEVKITPDLKNQWTKGKYNSYTADVLSYLIQYRASAGYHF